MKKEPLANGVTYIPDFGDCYAEFNARNIDFSACETCQACIFPGRIMMKVLKRYYKWKYPTKVSINRTFK